jgi:hypothetical protein
MNVFYWANCGAFTWHDDDTKKGLVLSKDTNFFGRIGYILLLLEQQSLLPKLRGLENKKKMLYNFLANNIG